MRSKLGSLVIERGIKDLPEGVARKLVGAGRAMEMEEKKEIEEKKTRKKRVSKS